MQTQIEHTQGSPGSSSAVVNRPAAKQPPGPKDPLGLKVIQRFRSAPLPLVMKLHKDHGDVVYSRMGPHRTFFFFHPDQIKEILTEKAKLLPKFRPLVRVLRQWDGNGLVLSEGEFWARQRRLVQPAFHLKRFERYADAMVRQSECLGRAWEALSDGSVVNVEEAMTYLTLEIAAKTFFDTEVSGETNDLRRAVAILSETAFREFGEVIHWRDWFPLPRIRAKKWAMSYLDSIIRRFIADAGQPVKTAATCFRCFFMP